MSTIMRKKLTRHLTLICLDRPQAANGIINPSRALLDVFVSPSQVLSTVRFGLWRIGVHVLLISVGRSLHERSHHMSGFYSRIGLGGGKISLLLQVFGQCIAGGIRPVIC